MSSSTLKRTKRTRDASEEMTLEEHIGVMREKLTRERCEVPQLYEQINKMRHAAETMTKRHEKRRSLDLLLKANELEQEARTRESMTREHRFEKLVVTYLRMYHKRMQDPNVSNQIEAYVLQSGMTKTRRASIMDEYLTEMNTAPPKVAMATRDECPRCQEGHKLVVCAHKSIMTCMKCGYAVSYLDATSTSTSFDEVVEFSQYSYKRVTHYMMWLSHVQGKETHRVSDDIIKAVMCDLYERQRLTCKSQVTQKKVRESLRKLKLRKAYDHVAQVTARISGVRPPRISPEMEEQLRNMFLQMQPAFAKHAPKSRTNFLSYSYVLYRSFQIMGIEHMCEGITLLKGRGKLEANDAIFRKMCETLGWPIFDLPADQ